MADKQLVVSGPVAVLATKDGSERYMWQGAPVSRAAFTAESIAHNLSIGLLSEVDAVEETPPDPADEKPSDSWNHERIDGWAASQEPAIEFVNPDPSKPLVKGAKLEQIAAELAKRSQ